jgi:predicted dienelactone hydrolase
MAHSPLPVSMTCESGRRLRPIARSIAQAGVLALTATLPLWGPSAQALEKVIVKVPLLETSITVDLNELTDPNLLLRGNSDLAELDRASNGAIGRKLIELLNSPVPLSLAQVADGSVGSPLLEQALLVLSSFGTIQGRSPDLSGRTLQEAFRKASINGEPSLLALMKAIPGKSVTLDIGRARFIVEQMQRQHRRAEALLNSTPAVTFTAATGDPLPLQRSEFELAVSHRSQPLKLLLLKPTRGANGQLVLISHGLWDGPESFEGWARLLASQGYSVVLPHHPGSDSSQQQAMLSGQVPPPGPEELELRPRDISAVIDAVAAGRLPTFAGVSGDRVVVIGHSWGATTTLQLSGLKPSDTRLRSRCSDVNDPERNLSWTLQCSWLKGVHRGAMQDGRVISVVAVSPPTSLLFDQGAAQGMTGRVLLVSGSHDWVVPPDPEAINPMARSMALGHRLVLAKGGDHFNLRPGTSADGGILGPLILAWTRGSFKAGADVRPSPSASSFLPAEGWGNNQIPLRDITNRVGNK